MAGFGNEMMKSHIPFSTTHLTNSDFSILIHFFSRSAAKAPSGNDKPIITNTSMLARGNDKALIKRLQGYFNRQML